VQLFIGVDSVPEYHRRAGQMGAETIEPPQKLPDGDELAIMLDPSGVPFGLLRHGRRRYSVRSATIGSTRAARRAGR
jgi:predicted enzyme related to lactoylglutathione lyase